jgi:hypothetical protein
VENILERGCNGGWDFSAPSDGRTIWENQQWAQSHLKNIPSELADIEFHTWTTEKNLEKILTSTPEPACM